jgi:hypothetical protein
MRKREKNGIRKETKGAEELEQIASYGRGSESAVGKTIACRAATAGSDQDKPFTVLRLDINADAIADLPADF